ncbi:MAG: shikimate kinase [Deltaproteobacteria bacterium]|nr:MAG: shikimate kinase [Deltaproteobacteria bacterium]
MIRRGEFPGVVLVGFMGSGKSSVGKELARRVGAEFVDVDEWIERSSGREIRDLFADEGEVAFRRRESAALREILAVEGRVVATGGGAFMDEGNRELLKGYGPVVYLEAKPETILHRLSGDAVRPLLRGGDREKIARDLLGRRIPGYRKADFSVGTDDRTVPEVADRIVERLAKRGGGRS